MIIDFRLVSNNRYPATLSVKLHRVIIGCVHLSHVHCIMVRIVNHSICSVYLNLKNEQINILASGKSKQESGAS